MLRAYAVALGSLLTGAAVVHALYKPDLVRGAGLVLVSSFSLFARARLSLADDPAAAVLTTGS